MNVGSVTFSENLSYCSDGCSTGFSDVAEGTNTITVKQTSASASVSVGSLGSFQKGNSYAVNIRTVNGSYCAELWQRLNTAPFFNNDTTRVLISTTCGGSTALTIPTATITVDGNTTDWNGISALATDPQGDSSTSYTGDDINALYGAKDSTNLYIRMDLWENANTNFWNFPSPNNGRYAFEIKNNGSYNQLYLGVAYDSNISQWSVGFNGSNGSTPSTLQGTSFVGVSGSVIELKVPLADIGNPTAFDSIRGEVNDCCAHSDPPTTLDEVTATP